MSWLRCRSLRSAFERRLVLQVDQQQLQLQKQKQTVLKKIFKILLGLFLFGLSIALLIPIGFAIYLETAIDRVASEENQKELFRRINESPELPQSFYETYNKYYPGTFETSFWESAITQVLTGKRKACHCKDIYYFHYVNRLASRFSAQIIALEVEEHCSQKKCFEYEMSEAGFAYGLRGIRNAAREFYNKELEELNEREIVALTIIPKGPSRYNPKRNPEKLNAAIDKILQKY